MPEENPGILRRAVSAVGNLFLRWWREATGPLLSDEHLASPLGLDPGARLRPDPWRSARVLSFHWLEGTGSHGQGAGPVCLGRLWVLDARFGGEAHTAAVAGPTDQRARIASMAREVLWIKTSGQCL